MSESNNFMTNNQARELLPENFKPCPPFPKKGNKQIIQTPQGIVAFHGSSRSKNGKWWTSHNIDSIRTEIDYLLFSLSYEGVLLLSREVLLSFIEKNHKPSSRWSRNGFKIEIYKENGNYIWLGKKGYTKDVTKHFYPNIE